MRRSLSTSETGYRSQLLERLDTVRRFDALEAVAAHQVHHHLAQSRLVVDDETVRVQFRMTRRRSSARPSRPSGRDYLRATLSNTSSA